MENVIAQLAELPSTCVSDALGGLTNLDPAIKPLREEWRVCGRAFTVQVRAADNLMVLKGIREAAPGDVLVIDAKGYLYNAVCGDFVVALMKTLGLAGAVVDGAVRDVLGIKQLDFPVFCRGTTVAASGKSGGGAVGVPISCGGVPVQPGDLILGDADGVVVIPRGREEEILQKAQTKLRKDEEREKDIIGNPEAARAYLDEMLSGR